METVESLKWLREVGLLDLAKDASMTIKKVLMPCLSIKDEKLLIIGDKGYKNKEISAVLSGAYYLAAEELKLNSKLVIQEVKSRGSIADYDVIQSLSSLEQGNIVIMNLSDKLGAIAGLGKSFRKLCQKNKFRFISTLSLADLETKKLGQILPAVDINYKPLQAEMQRVQNLLSHAEEVHIKTEAGTDLLVNIKGMQAIAADGNYSLPGTGGNIPAGEVYIPPNGKGVEGTVVVDGSSRNHKHTSLIKKPIKLAIKEGSIASIEGGEEAKQLQDALEWAATHSKYPGAIRRIGEIGIGLNPKASIIGSTIIDEKALGTAHIGIGSNYWFGGSIYAITHLDQIFKNPIISIDGKEI